MLELASCCERRQRQLEMLAKRCAAIGLEPSDVESLIDIAYRYRAFGRELMRFCERIDRDAAHIPLDVDHGDRTLDDAFRAVMDSELPAPTKREVRAAYLDLCRHQRARSALGPRDPNPTPDTVAPVHEPRER